MIQEKENETDQAVYHEAYDLCAPGAADHFQAWFFSGYRLTFTDREKTVLTGLLVIIVIAILVIGTIRIMSKG